MKKAAKTPRTTYRSPNRDKILDAAEIEFASNSYESCSLRMIADTSGVNLGLLHYYFGSKQALFSAVFLRRATKLVDRRMAILAEMKEQARGRPIPIKKLIRGFISPTVDMIREGPGPRSFIKLHSRLRTEPLDFASDLRRVAFNEVNRAYIDALHETCPHLSRASIVWRFTSMVGAYLFLLSQSGRVEDLSDGRCDSDDFDTAMDQVVDFCSGGFTAADSSEAVRRSRKQPRLRAI